MAAIGGVAHRFRYALMYTTYNMYEFVSCVLLSDVGTYILHIICVFYFGIVTVTFCLHRASLSVAPES